MRRALCLASLPPTLAAALTLSAGAWAVEIPNVAGEPMLVDVTNTAIFNYHFDNRNDNVGDPSTVVDDNYAEWIDRLNVQVGWWRLRLGLRLDTALFFGTLTRGEARALAAEGLGPEASGTEKNAYTNQFFRELNTRFIDTVYPSKLWVGYTQPGIDATVGDFYAQLGRGLVFSVRKIDELAVDTTVRGGKLAVDHNFGPVQVNATALAGQLNPLRVEETSGRRLNSEPSPLFFGFPEGQGLTTYEFNKVGAPVAVNEGARPSYLTDTVFGGRLEVGALGVQIAANGSLLQRKSYTREYLECEGRNDEDCASTFPEFGSTDPSRTHDTIRTFSGSINVPSIAGHGDLYLEVAGQQLRDGHLTSLAGGGEPEQREPDLSGYAVYGSANARWGPLTVSLEGKHYRRFFPLSANIDKTTKGFSGPEFEVVSYNQPPTAEPIYVEPIGSPNQCMTGGRGRADVRFTRQASIYAWLGRYVSYSEFASDNYECKTGDELLESGQRAEEVRTNTWDTAVGSDLDFEKGQSHTRAWVGARVTNLEVPTEAYVQVPDRTDEFYREGYVRYDVVKHITGPFSVQFQGFHRRRYEPLLSNKPWTEGENYTALQWSPHISAIVGYEYQVKEGCRSGSDVCHYVNGGLQWKSGSGDTILEQIFDTVQVFVGQRRGAIRCVSGVCRQFPPFEGAKLEIVSRF